MLSVASTLLLRCLMSSRTYARSVIVRSPSPLGRRDEDARMGALLVPRSHNWQHGLNDSI
jgi:hypothetical protein